MNTSNRSERLATALETLAGEVPTPEEKSQAKAAAAEQANEAKKLAKDTAALGRIASQAATQRTSWFWFYGTFAFAIFTLMGTADADFFKFTATTTLPVLNYEVNLLQFMTLAPVIILLVHIYLHVHLELLWSDLAKVRPTVDGDTLSTLTPAWLLIEAALYMRTWRRRGDALEQAIVHKTWFGRLGVAITLLLVWGGAPLVIAFFWWRSFVLHDLSLSMALGIALWICILISLWSFWRFATAFDLTGARGFGFLPKLKKALALLPTPPIEGMIVMIKRPPAASADIAGATGPLRFRTAIMGGAVLLAIVSFATIRTTGELPGIGPSYPGAAQAGLNGKALATKPADWRPRVTARRIYFSTWCKRYDTPPCPETADAAKMLMDGAAFSDEFDDLRRDYIAVLPTSSLAGQDLTDAKMATVFAPGVSFAGAVLSGAVMDGALLEEARLTDVAMTGTSLVDAKLPAARITGVGEDVDFTNAMLSQARIGFDQLEGGHFAGADLSHSRLSGEVVGYFSDSYEKTLTFEGADMTRLRLRDSYISGAFRGDTFRRVNILGLEDRDGTISVQPGNSARFDGTAFSYVDFSRVLRLRIDSDLLSETWQSVFANSFGDRSVVLPAGARYPCQWLRAPRPGFLQFFGTWRAWLEKGGRAWPPMQGLERYSFVDTDAEGASVEFTLDAVPALPDNIPDDCNWRD